MAYLIAALIVTVIAVKLIGEALGLGGAALFGLLVAALAALVLLERLVLNRR
jgi:hypothetical protein